MKLFFETAFQAQAFLMVLPVGLALGLCFDLFALIKKGRPLMDVLALLGCAAATLFVVQFSRDDGLRLYHLLALFLGAVLYFCGLGRLFRGLKRRLCSLKASKAHRKQVAK